MRRIRSSKGGFIEGGNTIMIARRTGHRLPFGDEYPRAPEALDETEGGFLPTELVEARSDRVLVSDGSYRVSRAQPRENRDDDE